MGPQSLYLCGFPEASVEMEVAPFRALTPFPVVTGTVACIEVEMEVAPFRALTQCSVPRIPSPQLLSRNGGRPIQGIDTRLFFFFS